MLHLNIYSQYKHQHNMGCTLVDIKTNPSKLLELTHSFYEANEECKKLHEQKNSDGIPFQKKKELNREIAIKKTQITELRIEITSELKKLNETLPKEGKVIGKYKLIPEKGSYLAYLDK